MIMIFDILLNNYNLKHIRSQNYEFAVLMFSIQQYESTLPRSK